MIKRKKKSLRSVLPVRVGRVGHPFFQEQFRFAETALTFRPRNEEKNLDRMPGE